MNQQVNWKRKVRKVVVDCQNEIKRTTQIGKKMLNASKTNTNLRDAYEELGQLVEKEMSEGRLEWNNERVQELLLMTRACRSDLDAIEGEMNKIRFSPAPDIIDPNSGPIKKENEDS
ncbi:MAG: hypothetical protein ACPGJV_01000 [Bacteriovoracaceae bacterium]